MGGIRTGPASEAGGLVAGALGGAGADPLSVQQSRTMSDARDAAQAPAAPPAVAARPLHSPAAWCSACWAGRPGWRQRGAGAPPHRRPARRALCRPRPLTGRVPGGRVHARAHAQGRTRAGGLALRLRPAEGEAMRCGGGGVPAPGWMSRHVCAAASLGAGAGAGLCPGPRKRGCAPGAVGVGEPRALPGACASKLRPAPTLLPRLTDAVAGDLPRGRGPCTGDPPAQAATSVVPA